MAEIKIASEQEAKAVNTGIKDGFLMLVFVVIGQAVAFATDYLLPLLSTWQDGKFAWAIPVLGVLLAAILKAVDRKKHEDPSPSTGLLKV